MNPFGTPGGVGYLDPFKARPVTPGYIAPPPQVAPIQATAFSAPQQPSAPEVPQSVYDSYRSGISSGQLSPQDAYSKLQELVSRGTYSGLSQSKLYAPLAVNRGDAMYGLTPGGGFQNLTATTYNTTSGAAGAHTTSSVGKTPAKPSLGLQSTLTTAPTTPASAPTTPTTPTAPQTTQPAGAPVAPSTDTTALMMPGTTNKKKAVVAPLGGIINQ